MKYILTFIIVIIPCICLAAADPVGMFQGAVNPYQTMGQGAVQELTIITVAEEEPPPSEAPSRVPPKIIINITQ